MLQALRKHLLEELEQAFPEEVEGYREIRASSAAVGYVELSLVSCRVGICIILVFSLLNKLKWCFSTSSISLLLP